jgi:retron-type reverse transcriptase
VSILDIEGCFPSVGPHRVRAALLRQGFSLDVAALITRLCTVHQELPQGAPTSPAILNLVLIDLDGKLSAIARDAGLTYTRYVDDICVSGGARAARIAMLFERVFRRHRFSVKLSKRCDWGPRDRHTVTGIVVNVRPNASPEYLATLRTTLLKHRSGESPLTGANLATVRGQLQYVKSLNPSVARRLERILESKA